MLVHNYYPLILSASNKTRFNYKENMQHGLKAICTNFVG